MKNVLISFGFLLALASCSGSGKEVKENEMNNDSLQIEAEIKEMDQSVDSLAIETKNIEAETQKLLKELN